MANSIFKIHPMKLLFLLASSAISIFPLNSATVRAERATSAKSVAGVSAPAMNNSNTLSFRERAGLSKLPVATFKDLRSCSADAADFRLEPNSSIVSATVYFYGKGFHGVAKGVLTGSSLQPIAELMKRCKAGTIVAFNEIKVLGPDKQIHSIDDAGYLLY